MEWISFKDRKPKTGSRIIVYLPNSLACCDPSEEGVSIFSDWDDKYINRESSFHLHWLDKSLWIPFPDLLENK